MEPPGALATLDAVIDRLSTPAGDMRPAFAGLDKLIRMALESPRSFPVGTMARLRDAREGADDRPQSVVEDLEFLREALLEYWTR